jgi:hypothetical protein
MGEVLWLDMAWFGYKQLLSWRMCCTNNAAFLASSRGSGLATAFKVMECDDKPKPSSSLLWFFFAEKSKMNRMSSLRGEFF